MKNKVFILIIAIMVCFIFGCGATTQAKEKVNNYMERIRVCHDVEEWRDTETGVHYLIYSEFTTYGYSSGICPRYNADGSLYVD